jgi:hypothetical protein
MPSSKFSIKLQAGPQTKYEERIAASGTAIKPGHLVKPNGTTVNQCILNAADNTAPEVALEDALQSKTLTDAYAPLDVVFTMIPQPGDVWFARVAAATYTEGQLLKAGANGQLVAVAATTDRVIARAEPLDANDRPVVSLAVAADGLLRVVKV